MGFFDLFKRGLRATDPDTRLSAVQREEDQDVLAELARTDSSARIRLAAVGRLTKQELLVAVALDGKEIDARIAAVERIESQDKLAEIIKIRKNLQLMGACFSRITDTNVLHRIANDTDYNISARRMAIENYADGAFLEDIIPTSGSRDTIKSPEEIDVLIKKYGGEKLARTLGRLRGSVNAIKALGQIMHHGGEGGRTALGYLAQSLIHANSDVRANAEEQLKQLTSTDLVVQLIRMLENPALHKRIMEILKQIDHPEARQIVSKG